MYIFLEGLSDPVIFSVLNTEVLCVMYAIYQSSDDVGCKIKKSGEMWADVQVIWLKKYLQHQCSLSDEQASVDEIREVQPTS